MVDIKPFLSELLLRKDNYMITLKELINALTEIANLDPENLTAQVKIYDKLSRIRSAVRRETL